MSVNIKPLEDRIVVQPLDTGVVRSIDVSAGDKVRAAYHCAGQLMCRAERLDACQRWPVGLRLMLVDDDLDLARWGWLQSGGQPVADPRSDIRVMRASNAACTEVLSALDKLADPTTDTLVS